MVQAEHASAQGEVRVPQVARVRLKMKDCFPCFTPEVILLLISPSEIDQMKRKSSAAYHVDILREKFLEP